MRNMCSANMSLAKNTAVLNTAVRDVYRLGDLQVQVCHASARMALSRSSD